MIANRINSQTTAVKLAPNPDGYNFRDFFEISFPLTLILFALVMIILPVFWSL